MSNALRNVVKTAKATPQTERARADQVKNNAGGFVFTVSDKDRLERFLILGTDGGTYYVGEKKLTDQNVEFLRKMIATDERLVIDTAVAVSVNGRAYRNSPAIFAIALVLSEGKDKVYAREAFNKIVRTSTHLFEAAEYVDGLGGWGRAKRKAFSGWYEDKSAESLAYQAVKYRQRNGWTHRDVLRLSHAQPDGEVAGFMLGKSDIGGSMLSGVDRSTQIISGFKALQEAQTVSEVVMLIETVKLPWEAIPTQFLKDVRVWKALFENGQLKGQALIRNVTRLARLGAFSDMVFARQYADALTNEEMIAKARLHPINFLNASVVYAEGQTDRRLGYYAGKTKDWTSEAVITDALNEGFHLAFKSVEPAGKRTMLAIDVSGSMSAAAMGLDLSCAQVSGALAMTVARTEPYHMIRGFTGGGGWYGRGAAELTDLGITGKTSLPDAMRKVQDRNFGGTDCAAPMVWAAKNNVAIDTFAVITDNETWAGSIQPFQALRDYRQKMGIDARLAVFGVAGSEFTIADKNDRGMMDFVGFDSAAPRVFADFSAGRL